MSAWAEEICVASIGVSRGNTALKSDKENFFQIAIEEHFSITTLKSLLIVHGDT